MQVEPQPEPKEDDERGAKRVKVVKDEGETQGNVVTEMAVDNISDEQWEAKKQWMRDYRTPLVYVQVAEKETTEHMRRAI